VDHATGDILNPPQVKPPVNCAGEIRNPNPEIRIKPE
jgi:hypothetical protein